MSAYIDYLFKSENRSSCRNDTFNVPEARLASAKQSVDFVYRKTVVHPTCAPVAPNSSDYRVLCFSVDEGYDIIGGFMFKLRNTKLACEPGASNSVVVEFRTSSGYTITCPRPLILFTEDLLFMDLASFFLPIFKTGKIFINVLVPCDVVEAHLEFHSILLSAEWRARLFFRAHSLEDPFGNVYSSMMRGIYRSRDVEIIPLFQAAKTRIFGFTPVVVRAKRREEEEKKIDDEATGKI